MDLLGSIHLATEATVLLAPAMNGKMLAHPATQDNIRILQKRGCLFVDPVEGMLACGYQGMGKLAPVNAIVERVVQLFNS